jgi:transcriptional regulator, propionate catabolism operon regulatory protein
MQNYQENGSLPRICFMSYRQLKTFSLPIVNEYNNIAQIEIIEASFEQTLAIAKNLIQNRQVDVFVSAGSNAEILKAGLQVPVITIEVSGYDLMNALIRAKDIDQRVGIINYGNVIPALDDFKNILAIDLIQYKYKTPEVAKQCIAQLKEQGISVVLGSSLIIDMVKNAGMNAILPYSHDSIRKAFDQALEVARITRLEAIRFEQINSLLHTLPEAVVAVDAQEQIIAINHTMLEILSPAGIDIRGRILTEIQPELSLKKTLQSTEKSQPIALQLLGRDWVSHRTPILDQNRIVGAALTLYDARTIYTADTELRMFERARQYTARHQFETIFGQSKPIQETIERAKCFAKSDLDILILGESGTGKELFAQSIHNSSQRSIHPFIAVNCAAFPESLIEGELFGHDDGAFTGSKRGGRRGLIEAAHKGTLFLDEIGDMPLSLQTRLLRVLQEREITRLGSNSPIPVDIRIIAATHQPLKLLVQHQKFRQDLYYRLNTIQLSLPTLRQRADDIEPLFLFFLQKHAQLEKSHPQLLEITEKLAPYLKQYAWPGNIRELESMTQRIALWIQAHNKPLSLDRLLEELPELLYEECHSLLNINPCHSVEHHFSNAYTHGHSNQISLPEFMKNPTSSISKSERVRQAMYIVNGHQEAAAKLLGISRTTLWRWLKALD